MNQIVGLIIVVISAIIYVVFNVFRFIYMRKNLDFDIFNKKLFYILFIGVRLLIISAYTVFFIFTLKEYLMFCYLKMIFFMLTLTFVFFLESFSAYFNTDDDYLWFFVALITCGVYIIATSILVCLQSFLGTSINVPDKIDVEKRYIITASDQNVIKGEVSGSMFGINGYLEQGDWVYCYYYLSEDNKEILDDKCDGKNTIRKIIGEEEKPYIEVKTITKQYYNIEEKERVIHEGKTTVQTVIYAPLSAYSGIGFDAK